MMNSGQLSYGIFSINNCKRIIQYCLIRPFFRTKNSANGLKFSVDSLFLSFFVVDLVVLGLIFSFQDITFSPILRIVFKEEVIF